MTYYADMTYERILERSLSRVPDGIDKREGSIIYDALAPAAAELAQIYIELDENRNLSYADTAYGTFLERRTAEFGINREAATKAQRKGLFYGESNAPLDIPVGSRFSLEGLNFVAVKKILPGQYQLECEVAGVQGNQQFGAMLPIDYIANLTRAELTDVLVPGEDEETDDILRARYSNAVNEKPFGGNIADYKREIEEINGVGGVKVYPTWQGGGTVKCTIITSEHNVPDPALVTQVQTFVDPTVSSGLGNGLAPIGHKVTIAAVVNTLVNVTTRVTLQQGVTVGQVQADIEKAIRDYLLGLCKSWKDENQLVVRIAQIDARLLTVTGVEDVMDTKLNGAVSNITLGTDDIPKLGTVVISV
ncbi:baseplate J/gp47 family protein [Paenibacillus arenosi]|uniref:Baseplate J/gp47 family protein n=1 Tax=Paenibacillus arenosi TaxID=2774142 RepID=A0ABR9B3G3_9BACL|nr:baseplate J/gp47 family protein [Paenibacillus arenosi]MBD8499972.1 baseplate J/gp47 family protein [Paenibacillus arenosi]